VRPRREARWLGHSVGPLADSVRYLLEPRPGRRLALHLAGTERKAKNLAPIMPIKQSWCAS
jgi:hypothetical protein